MDFCNIADFFHIFFFFFFGEFALELGVFGSVTGRRKAL